MDFELIKMDTQMFMMWSEVDRKGIFFVDFLPCDDTIHSATLQNLFNAIQNKKYYMLS